MNLQKLFEAQQVLDEHIMNEHPELHENESNLDWKLLALQVELGECANEWRGFKWSNDQRARGEGKYLVYRPIEQGGNYWVKKNPMLEEYVDCLHFILSIGLELPGAMDYFAANVNFNIGSRTKQTDTIVAFGNVFELISHFKKSSNLSIYYQLLSSFMTLGDSLGFTEEQIEAAYFVKNKTNHRRQEEGY